MTSKTAFKNQIFMCFYKPVYSSFSILLACVFFLSACSTPIVPSDNQKTLDDYIKQVESKALQNHSLPSLPLAYPNAANLSNSNPQANQSIGIIPNQQTLDWSPLPDTYHQNAQQYSNDITSGQVVGTPTQIPFMEAPTLEYDFNQAIVQDTLDGFWPAWIANCQKLARQSKWQNACQQAKMINPADIESQKKYLKQYFNPQKLMLRNQDQSKITGYYEPLLKGSRQANAVYRYPVYQKPSQNASQIQSWTRQQLLQTPILQGKELIYLANPVDAALVEIQGSALIELDESHQAGYAPFTASSWLRVAFDGANQHNFKSFIQYLLNKKYITRSEMAIPVLRNWAMQNPYLIQEAIQSNPRFIFFKPIAYNQGGPIGAYGLALTPQRSIAVDTNYVELGTPMIIKFNHPTLGLIHRFVIAQDVGNAIKGSVRADFFWGLGEEALKLASATNTEGELTMLLPKF
jgi:membrane-bound lytic murein transglycosylase A